MRSFPIVDSHAHVFLKTLEMVSERRYTPESDATMTSYLTLLDRMDILYGVLVQPSFLGADNSYMLEMLERYPTRFRGVAVVDPDIDVVSLDALNSAGVCGIRLNLIGRPLPDLSSSQWDALLGYVVAHKWHVELHSHAVSLPTLIPPLLIRGCQVVVDHFGRPDATLNETDPGFRFLLEVAKTRQVWVKVSAGYRVQPQSTVKLRILLNALLDAFTADYLVWGSDWPHSEHPQQLQHPNLLQEFGALVDDKHALKIMLSETPCRLFHF